jgi:hypothetical protein
VSRWLQTSCVNRRFGGTSVHTRSTRRHFAKGGIFIVLFPLLIF